MKSSSQHSFAVAPQVNIPRSSFRRNCNYKGTINAGYLNCVYVDEVLPGDTFNFKLTAFARMISPLKFPLMDNLYLDFFIHFCAVRLVYEDYEKFFGSSKGASGNWEYDDSHLMPSITADSTNGFAIGSLADQFGIPTGVPSLKVNALPFRCYNRIVADWFRPSCYELSMPTLKVDSTDDSESDYPLQKSMKKGDFFTTALPSPQRGDGVMLPLGTSAPVVGTGKALGLTDGTNEYVTGLHTSHSEFRTLALGANVSGGYDAGDNVVDISGYRSSPPDKSVLGVSEDPDWSGLRTDLSNVTAYTINSMRQAFQLQRALERDMRGGVAYREQLMAHFGVRSPDARLQKTEYLGGGSVPINIHTVVNQSAFGTSGSDPKLGSLGGYAVGSANNIGFVKSFVEHGYILVLCRIRSDLSYQQGLPKMFDRFARFDFFYPVFQNLGEQVIKNKEIFAQGPSVTDSDGNIIDEQPFGYQERFGEYRYGTSKITGLFRSTAPIYTFDSWHLAQKFNNLPTLSDQFLLEDVPISRVTAYDPNSGDYPPGISSFIYDSYIECNCVRPMSLFGVPGLVDHF